MFIGLRWGVRRDTAVPAGQARWNARDDARSLFRSGSAGSPGQAPGLIDWKILSKQQQPDRIVENEQVAQQNVSVFALVDA
jgi:hypothetical protein